MKTCLMLWERLPNFGIDPAKTTPEDISEVAVTLADHAFKDHFGYQRAKNFHEQAPEEVALWMFHSVAVQWFGLWTHYAFPRVQMSHSFAAMMLATTISPKELPHLEAPWPAFLIEIPDGLLPIQGRNGVMTHIRRAHITSHFLPTAMEEGTRWWSIWMTGGGIEIHRVGYLSEAIGTKPKEELSLAPLRRIHTNRVENIDMPFISETGDQTEADQEFWDGYDRVQEDRVSALVGRLLTGVCAFMTQRSNWKEKEVLADKLVANLARRMGKSPTSRVYTIGKPVNLDFKPAIAAYLSGQRSSVTAQSLVAGHHKRQPVGPNGEHRKWIFVEPYWRGPEFAPILVRPHQGK